MRLMALLTAGLALMAIGLLLRAEVDFRYRRRAQKDHLEIKIQALAGWWRFRVEVPTLALGWEQGPQLEISQMTAAATGGRRTHKTAARFRYVRRGLIYRLWSHSSSFLMQLQRIKRKFYRSIQCTHLDWRVEIGYANPVATALAAGAFWSMLGTMSARLYRQVTVRVQEPYLLVVPQFQKPGFACDFHCIFDVRIGHIIFAGFRLLWTLRRLGRR